MEFQDRSQSISRRAEENPVVESAERAVHSGFGNNLMVFKEREISLRTVTVRPHHNDTGWRISEIEIIHGVVPVMELEPADEKKEVQREEKIQGGCFFGFIHHVCYNISSMFYCQDFERIFSLTRQWGYSNARYKHSSPEHLPLRSGCL